MKLRGYTIITVVLMSIHLTGCGSSGGSGPAATTPVTTTDTSGTTAELNGGGALTSSNTSTVLGRIMLPASGPLPVLTAQLANGSASAAVRSSGDFTLDNVPVGTQTLQIVNNGTVIEVAEIQLQAGDIYLVPLPDPATAATGAGIMGVAYKGPLSATSRLGDPNEGPLPGAMIQVKAADGSIAATLTADTNGMFSQNLPAGQYTLVPLAGGGGQALPLAVTVASGRSTFVQLNYSTGVQLTRARLTSLTH